MPTNYNNLSNENVLKLLHNINQGIITDMEENKALKNMKNKTIRNKDKKKEQTNNKKIINQIKKKE